MTHAVISYIDFERNPMNKLLATLITGLFAASAYAQGAGHATTPVPATPTVAETSGSSAKIETPAYSADPKANAKAEKADAKADEKTAKANAKEQEKIAKAQAESKKTKAKARADASEDKADALK